MKRRYSTVLAIGALCLFSCFTGMPALAVETILYVGKHFEVRDHDQPTKYVFNGDTRIARIIGSLSTNTRIQRFRLRSGWNLLSLAVSATNVSDQLQRSGVINSARAWNPQTANYSTVPQVVPAGTVLWVNASTNTTIGVVGTYADPVNRPLSAGATYLPGTGLEAWAPTLPPSVTAWSFNSQPTWLARLTGDLSSVNDLPRIFAPGQALYVINTAPFELEAPDPALRIRYYHQDHLGSSSVMTDANGALVEETAFYPFGMLRNEHRPRQIEEPYKFTQKERDRESGLHYFEARYLARGLARFMTQDPKYAHPDALFEEDLVSFVSQPQKLNLSAYVHNNPLNYVDPTGLEDDEDDDGGFFDLIVETSAVSLDLGLETMKIGATKGAPNFFAGFYDSMPMGRTTSGDMVSKVLKAGKVVDEDSLPYKAGEATETVGEVALGAYEVKLAIGAARGGGKIVTRTVVEGAEREATTVATGRAVGSGRAVVSGRAAEIATINESIAAGQAQMRAAALAREQALANWRSLTRAQQLDTFRVVDGKMFWGPFAPK